MKNSYDMEFDKIHVTVMSYDTKKTWLMIQIKLDSVNKFYHTIK